MASPVFSLLQSRVLTHYNSAQSILAGKMPAPRTAILYPTYKCNLACPGCEYQEDNRKINRQMTRRQLFSALRQLTTLGVQGVEFCGGGEPTLHPDLGGAILYLAKKGVRTGLLTNGIPLTGKLAEIAVRHCSYIRISLDAADRGVYNKVKRPAKGAPGFDAVIANIRNLVRLKKKLKSPVTLNLKYLICKQNLAGMEKAAKLSDAMGLDSLQFKGLRIFTSQRVKGEEAWVRARIRGLQKAYPALALVGSIEKVNVSMQCWLSPLQVTVDALGDVYLCCYYRHRKERHTIGNLFKTPLKKLWGAKRHWQAVRAIRPAECNRLDCRFAEYNRIMKSVMVDNKGQLEFI